MNASVRHGAATDIGRREINEDAFVASPPLYAVADGMGGHHGGDVAAQTAVEVLAHAVSVEGRALLEGVREANREIHRLATTDPKLRGMGTTITAMVAGDGSLEIVHVGDSRAYLLREGGLVRITQDHSLVERMVREGRLSPEHADSHPQRSVLERALGVQSEVQVDSHLLDTLEGDRLLLCSDGLTGVLNDEEIRAVLVEEASPEEASRQLIAEAVEAGGTDNITALVVDYPGRRPPRAPTAARPRRRFFTPRKATVAGIVLGLAVLLAVAGRAALYNAWYVGDDRGRVTIFRGPPESVAGFDLSRPVERTDLLVASLPQAVRQDLAHGIRAEDAADARRIVADLRRLPSVPGGGGTTTVVPGASP